MSDESTFDAIVCGGGPAGLTASLWLGRYRRATALFDSNRQRNLAAERSHGYLSRDGCSPREILELGRSDLEHYDDVRVFDQNIEAVERRGGLFVVRGEGKEYVATRLMLCTGVRDVFPDIPGLTDLYGTSVFHCSCCDGYEARGQRVLAIGWGEHAAGYAIDLLDWGAEVTLVTNGEEFEGDGDCRAALERNGIELIEERVVDMQRAGSSMTGVRLEDGRRISATMAFFSIAHSPRTELAKQVGCELDDDGYVVVDAHGKTSVEGVYAAGDVTPGEQLVQVAASEGATAGIACAMSLRGTKTRGGGPQPGPDPEQELTT